MYTLKYLLIYFMVKFSFYILQKLNKNEAALFQKP